MATKSVPAATANFDLGDAAEGSPGKKVIQITFGTLVGSFVVNSRVSGSSAAYKPISYVRRYINGAVGDDLNGNTAITADSIIEVKADGLEIQLAYTHTSGAGPGRLDYKDVS